MPEEKNPKLDEKKVKEVREVREDEEVVEKKDPEKFSRPVNKSEAPPEVLESDRIITVDIRNRKEQFFKGDAKTVSSVNDTGEFDVLPKHANFVTLIRAYVIVDKGLPTEKKFDIDGGVLAAKTDSVDVYLDF